MTHARPALVVMRPSRNVAAMTAMTTSSRARPTHDSSSPAASVAAPAHRQCPLPSPCLCPLLHPPAELQPCSDNTLLLLLTPTAAASSWVQGRAMLLLPLGPTCLRLRRVRRGCCRCWARRRRRRRHWQVRGDAGAAGCEALSGLLGMAEQWLCPLVACCWRAVGHVTACGNIPPDSDPSQHIFLAAVVCSQP